MNPQQSNIRKLVYTHRDRCRVCFTCVRECPAKAIRIISGQAEVIDERCIGCGNCTRVCSQGAKQYLQSIDEVYKELSSSSKTIACVAPSFPAEFEEFDYKIFVGMIKELGFDYVTEVAFGADIVADKYKNIFKENIGKQYITANCPAIVFYIRQYYPELVSEIAPIVSPIVAMSRVIRKIHGDDSKIVFIGPCIAKKAESLEIDHTITFEELRKMFKKSRISPVNVEAIEFNEPVGGKGAIFPISRGMVQSVDIKDDSINGNVIVAEGRINFQDAIKEFSQGLIKDQNLELLCCEGCIMGPGMSPGRGKQYARQTLVSNYVRAKLENFDKKNWEKNLRLFNNLDISCQYEKSDRRIDEPNEEEIQKVLFSMNKRTKKDNLNCGACGYDTCREHAIAISLGFAEVEMCLPFAINKLHNSINDLAVSNSKLASVQQALKQSEKLASMGQLSAGIAHELNNPLGVVIMYANILLEESNSDSQQYSDLQLIVQQADRCKKIVGGLLNFARKNQVCFEEVDLEKFAIQCYKSIVIPSEIDISLNSFLTKPMAFIDTEQMTQALSNLLKNAIEAMPSGGKLSLVLEESNENVIIKVEDTGKGISGSDIDKIFEPFFTTKGIGKGTGLGLATTYGIVKMHKGQITVKSNDKPDKGCTGTSFTIQFPRKNKTIN